MEKIFQSNFDALFYDHSLRYIALKFSENDNLSIDSLKSNKIEKITEMEIWQEYRLTEVWSENLMNGKILNNLFQFI